MRKHTEEGCAECYSCAMTTTLLEVWWIQESRAPFKNGSPLQYSCLENPMDGGAWRATVHGVAKSRTQLSDFTFTFTWLPTASFESWDILTFHKYLLWSLVDLQCWISFKFIAKWFSCMCEYINSFSDSFPMRVIMQCWAEFSVWCSRSLLNICFIYNSVFMLIQNPYPSPHLFPFIMISSSICFCDISKFVCIIYFRFHI